MRFDGKSTGLFSDEEPKNKKKRRIKITEDQYNRLFNINEQYKYDHERYLPKPEVGSTTKIDQSYLGYSDRKIKDFDPFTIKKELNKKELDESEDSIDFIIDVASAVLDGIPGIGNAASFVIDVLHSISYFIRGNNESDEIEKITHYAGGFITASFAFIPFGGNAASMVVKQGIKPFIKLVMTSGKQHAIRLGFKKGIYLLKWKYSFLLLLYRFYGEELENILSDIIVTIKKIKDILIDNLTGYWIGDPLGIKSKLKYIDGFIKILEEIKPYIDEVKKVYESLKSYNLINEEDEGGESTSSSSGGGGGSVWTSGASSYNNLTRGKANPIDSKSVWNSGINRGPANPL